MTQTMLDHAFAAMEAAPENDSARLRFYERLADAELFMILASEPNGDQIDPEVIEVDDQSFVLVFDTEDRLADFTGKITPYVGLSGRVLVSMLAGSGLGLGLNLDVAPSSTLLPFEAMEWLDDMLSQSPDEVEARPIEFSAPRDVPQVVLEALDAKLVSAAGLASEVWLTGVTYEGGAKGHLLAFIDTPVGAENALAKAAHEALTFSGIEAGSIDVAFFDPTEGAAIAIRRCGLCFELPEPTAPNDYKPAAPGMDPDKPPRLK
jgi:hypothetical protein